MPLHLDDQWLEKMDGWGLGGLTVQRKRRLYRIIMVGVIGLSYLIDFVLLVLFAQAGTIKPAAVWFYGAAGLTHVQLFSLMHWTGFSERFANPHMTLWAMGYAVLVQAVSIVLAPQLAFFFLGIVFVIFAFGTLRISLQEALAVWLFACSVIALTLEFLVHSTMGTIGTSEPSHWQHALVAAAFAIILLRTIALGYYSTALRMRMFARNHALEQAATHDALTGLGNRNAVLPAMENYIKLCRRKRMTTVVAMLDIDHFKDVNDTFGHIVGDVVLGRLARFINAMLRESDMAARYGGEEFIIVLPATRIEEIMPAIERIREGVEGLTWPEIQEGLRVTVSCGVTEIVATDSVDTVIARADNALYEAKKSGRNRVCRSVNDGVANA